MSLIARPSMRIFNNISQCIKFKGTSWTKYSATTASLRSFHQACILNGEGIPLRMPSLSPTMEEGKIVAWLKQEGDTIVPGDVLCEIETDKAVVAFDTDEEGVLAKILFDQNSGIIKIGTMIAVLAPEGEDWKTIQIPVDGGAPARVAPPAAVAAAAEADDGRKMGPSVRLLLETYGLSAGQVAGSGPHGELLKGDVLKHIESASLHKVEQKAHAPPAAVAATPAPAAAPAAPKPAAPKPAAVPLVGAGSYTDLEVSGMRRTIAKRLTQSKMGIAHSYATIDCRIDELMAVRKQFRKDGVALTLNDFVVKAVAVALRTCPAVNCVWQGDQLVESSTVDISVAVATPNGLITPIVHNTDHLGIKGISDKIRELVARAKDGKLKPEEFQGGTFTISNLGMFGILEFTAIINPPQCAILAVGGGIISVGADGKPETRMRATMSYDRVAIDDDTATEFLTALAELIQNPHQMLLGVARPILNYEDHPLAELL
uniref:Dihydrolipoamide acetyltransferase component of pyruvate dehydrogenase complex n=1 Tax=Hirondellea gigas TaxID=1518452 RepID=A0A2P2HWX3_9CRUS